MGILRDIGMALGFVAPRDPMGDIEHLYHVTHINNLSSILQYGLLSHSNAHRSCNVTDISDREVSDRHSRMTIEGKPLREYALLYFNPSNPMLYSRKEIQNDIVILAFNKEALWWGGTWFTDGNAASNATEFYYDLDDLHELDWSCIWDEYWNGHDDGRRKRCAEILVPDAIHPSWIEQIIVQNTATRSAVLRRVRSNIPVTIQPWMCF